MELKSDHKNRSITYLHFFYSVQFIFKLTPICLQGSQETTYALMVQNGNKSVRFPIIIFTSYVIFFE